MTEERPQPAGEPDADVLNGLVAAHRADAYRLARAVLGDPDAAEDVAQDVSVRLTAALPGFERGADLNGWVYRVTMNRCRDLLRHGRRRAADIRVDVAGDHPGLASETDPGRMVDAEWARAAVTRAMERLSEEHQQVLTLRYVAGLPYAEIARITSTPQGTVASRVFRALRMLGDHLDRRHLEVLE